MSLLIILSKVCMSLDSTIWLVYLLILLSRKFVSLLLVFKSIVCTVWGWLYCPCFVKHDPRPKLCTYLEERRYEPLMMVWDLGCCEDGCCSVLGELPTRILLLNPSHSNLFSVLNKFVEYLLVICIFETSLYNLG